MSTLDIRERRLEWLGWLDEVVRLLTRHGDVSSFLNIYTVSLLPQDREAAARRPLHLALDDLDLRHAAGSATTIQPHTLDMTQWLEYLQEQLRDDPAVAAILECAREGASFTEIRAISSLSQDEYASARHRLRRKLDELHAACIDPAPAHLPTFLRDAALEDLDSTSDEQLLEEARLDGLDVDALAASIQGRFEQMLASVQPVADALQRQTDAPRGAVPSAGAAPRVVPVSGTSNVVRIPKAVHATAGVARIQVDASRPLFRYLFGSADFNEALQELRVKGEVAVTEPRHLRLLSALLRADGAPLSRKALLALLWGNRDVSLETLDRSVARLRAALGENDAFIATSENGEDVRFDFTRGDGVSPISLSDAPAEEPRPRLRAGDPVPNAPDFILNSQLARSPGMEIWLAASQSEERRVFKLALDGRRLESLAREVAIYRVLQRQLGSRPDILRMVGWNLDKPPYFLACEHGGQDLQEWATEGDRLRNLPRTDRLQLCLLIAEALSAVHEAGVLHLDLTPSNILVAPGAAGWRVRLADFGRGRLVRAADHELDPLGLTQQDLSPEDLSRAPFYRAPEVRQGGATSSGSDVYTLGVIVYQVLVGDFGKTLETGWERDIEDKPLESDIMAATDWDPKVRISSVTELIDRLRCLPERHSALKKAREQEQASRQRQERSGAGGSSAGQRGWREELGLLWRRWSDAIEAARRRGEDELPALTFPDANGNDEAGLGGPWVPDASRWACMQRGLGDWARFALMSYLDRTDWWRFDPETVRRVPADPTWISHVNAAASASLLERATLEEFELQAPRTQQDAREPSVEQRVSRLQPLFDDRRLWDALAGAANSYVLEHKGVRHAGPLTGDEIRSRRFAGPAAVIDFIRYINTGIVPARQAPFPDELRDLGVLLPSGFVREMPFFDSEARSSFIPAVAQQLAAGPDGGRRPGQPEAALDGAVLGISCLWSSLQPHGLVAACRAAIEQYDALCFAADSLRLPVIYIPVGRDAKTEYVSRRAAVRDLHRKLVVRRAVLRGKGSIPQPLPENPTGEEVDGAIAQIRTELTRSPALLVFGIYQVPLDLGPLQAEILDSPLLYLIQRLMPETGDLAALTDPQIAHATQLLILADGPLDSIAGHKVTSFELPECPADHFGPLLRSSAAARLEKLRSEPAAYLPALRDIVSNEIELSLVETALALQERSCEPHSPEGIGARVMRLIWGEHAAPEGEARVSELVRTLVSHLAEEAGRSQDAAWLLILLHIVALTPTGIRLFTIARVTAGYLSATAACGTRPRPDWCLEEAELWRPRPDALSGRADEVSERRAHRELEFMIQQRVEAIKDRAGVLILSVRGAAAPGFDEYPHPYECQESPPFKFGFSGDDGRQQLEFLAPLVRRTVLEELRRRCPQRHSLLSRLLAEEFIRRALIVRTHRADTDLRSLVDHRYVILGIQHGLDSLAIDLKQMLSRHGRLRSSWLIPHRTRLATYHWIYQGLYVELLNGGDNALSQQHGAKLVKRQLLEEFLRADPAPDLHRQPERYRDRSTLRHFEVLAEIDHGLAHVGLYTCDARLARDALERVRKLTALVRATLQDPACGAPEELKAAWARRLLEVSRQSAKLMLDVAVSQSASQPSGAGGPAQVGAVVQAAFDALEDPAAGRPLDRQRIVRSIMRALRDSKVLRQDSIGSRPKKWQPALRRAARELRDSVPDPVMQSFYDLLLRYGELVAYSADPIADDDARIKRRRCALLIFEVAQTLRSRYASPGGHVLRISPRPARNAARVCLSLAKWYGSDWFRERAGYYCLHVMESRSQQRIDRIALLILRAMTIRILGTPEELPLAMQFLKTAERSLINYADRVELWIRFHLERAKLFRERALQPGTSKQEAHWCAYYCRSDIASVIRLAGGREGWVTRAEVVLRGLPFP
jgi:hypothetical protein